MKTFVVLAAIVATASAGVLLSSPVALTSQHLALTQPLALARTVIAAPAVAVPAVTASQYHAQDELGQFSYGYAGGPSAKAETKTADGVTRGGYSYIDANGVLQTVNYVSDAAGFRVAATNLPVAPVAGPAVVPGPIPQPVQETPEVAKARAEHEAAKVAAAAAAAAAPDN